jgi:acyl-CoA dehydrogenase
MTSLLAPDSSVDSGLHDHTHRLREWLAVNAEALRPFGERSTESLAVAIEHDRRLLRMLYEAGWSRWGWSEAAGGLGGPIALRAVLYDELAAADVEIPEAFVILETLGPVLEAFAPSLAADHLPRYLSGVELWGQGFSEPDAGSDLARLRTRAGVTQDGFVLNGQKTWTTLGQFAQYAAVLARTGTAEEAHRGLSMLWVDLNAPGVTVRPIKASNGRDEFAEMFFDDVEVPRSGLIGDLGGGWSAAMYLLQYERGMYAWQRQALLHRRLREMTRVAAAGPTRPSASAVIALGEAVMAAAALRARSARTVRRLSGQDNPGPEISIDKVLLAMAEQATFDAARLLLWATMAMSEEPRALLLREEWFYSRASSIFGGAIDIQRDIVADRVLALPRGSR